MTSRKLQVSGVKRPDASYKAGREGLAVFRDAATRGNDAAALAIDALASRLERAWRLALLALAGMVRGIRRASLREWRRLRVATSPRRGLPLDLRHDALPRPGPAFAGNIDRGLAEVCIA